MRHFNIIVELCGLQLRQIRIGILGEHGEHEAPTVGGVIDNERFLKRHHAGIALPARHEHAAMQVVVDAQRLQRGLFEPRTKHRAADR